MSRIASLAAMAAGLLARMTAKIKQSSKLGRLCGKNLAGDTAKNEPYSKLGRHGGRITGENDG